MTIKVKASYYKETEYLLYNYDMFKMSIKNMNIEIENIKKEDGAKGIAYDGVQSSPTNKFNSATENTALANIEKIAYLEHSIRSTEDRIESIDRTLKELTECERSIIIDRYIKAKPWYIVAYNVSYGERQCRNKRRDAIEKMAIGIFGDIAIEGMQ